MRKVKYKVWIDAEFHTSLGWTEIIKKGTGCFSDFNEVGQFHSWGVSYEEFESDIGNYTIGIIEKPNGEIVEVLPSNIKFITETKECDVVLSPTEDNTSL